MIELASLKAQSFSEAKDLSLPVYDDSSNTIAELVPIGYWALADESLITAFSQWRKRFMRFFFTQFKASAQSTRWYLENLSIAQDDRIFFAIFVDERLVGHIGLSHINENKAELDNIIRGVSGGHPGLMYFAEKTLNDWAFNVLNIKTISAQVMSNNSPAMRLYERIGFTLKERFHLLKTIKDDTITYERCSENEATETFFLDIIELDKRLYQSALEK